MSTDAISPLRQRMITGQGYQPQTVQMFHD